MHGLKRKKEVFKKDDKQPSKKKSYDKKQRNDWKRQLD